MGNRIATLFAASVLGGALLAATPPEPASLAPAVIDPPAPPGALAPALATEGSRTVSQHHDLLLTWFEPAPSGGRLRFSRWTGAAWNRPVTVATPVSLLDARDEASLTVIETQAVRRTLLARTGDVLVRSGDGGLAWSRLPGPTLPFSSFAGAEDGGFAFWQARDRQGNTSLLGTRVLSGQAVLDPAVRPETPTSAALTWDGAVVVYRALDPSDACDVALVRRDDGEWSKPVRVSTTTGRALRGPRVTAAERRVAVAWTSAVPGGARVLVAFSTDAGRTFAEPIEVAGPEAGVTADTEVALSLDGEGHAVVLWMAAQEPIRLARVAPDGRLGEPFELVPTPLPPASGQPQLVRAGDKFAASWLEGKPSRVRVATLPLAGLPASGSRRPRGPAPAVGHPAAAGHGKVGDRVPETPVTSLAGKAVTLPDLGGRVVMLNLWATWCMPCLAEMPELAKLQERYRKDGLVVVGLSVDTAEAEARVRAMVAERQMPFDIWLDPEMKIYKALRVRTLPTTLILDRTGTIRLRRDQAIKADDPEISRALAQALAEK